MTYAGFDAAAWGNFRDNLSARKSIKLMNLFFKKEVADTLGVSYVPLRLVDDGVDLPREEGEDKRRVFLNTIEKMFLETEPGYHEVGEKTMAAENPLDLLIPGPDEEITETHTDRVLKTFYHNYRHLDNEGKKFLKSKLGVFFGGMRTDLDNEGKLFTQGELDKYFDSIQTEPIIIGLLAVADLKNGSDEVNYEKFYDSIKWISRGIMNIKNSRGKELDEDAEMDRVYFSDEELSDAGLGRKEFLDIVNDKREDKRLNEMIEKRVHKANAYFNKGAEVIMKLPDDGIYSGLKKYMVAYGLLAKRWGRNLAKNDYNPFRGDGYLDIEPGTAYKLYMFLNAKRIGKGNDEKIFEKVLEWKFLDTNLLRGELQEVGYWTPTGV
jgi:phytoene/squalene synthetase